MSANGYLLGVDIGTSSTKAVAFSEKGEYLGEASQSYSIKHPNEGWSEQDPEEIVMAVLHSINKISRQFGGNVPLLISFSAAMHSLILIDKDQCAITPSIIWADNRSEAMAASIKAAGKAPYFYKRTGVPVHAMSPFCKLLWLKKNDPDVFNRASRFVGIKEYIFFQLTGEWLVDTSIASATGLLNLQQLQWDTEILDYVGISGTQLSKLVSTKHVLQFQPGKQLPFKNAFPLIIGGSDGAMGNLGSLTKDKALVINIGTSSAARMTVTGPVLDERMQTFCYHVKDDQYIMGGASNNGAFVVQWLKNDLLETQDDLDQLISEATQIEAGTSGLLFIPYIMGERAPLWDEGARGIIFGLTVNHTRAHLVRATLEGIIFCLYSIAEIISRQSHYDLVCASGGFVRNEACVQLLADIFQKKLVVQTEEASAMGAVILGAEALGISFHPPESVRKEFEPDKSKKQHYQQLFDKFKTIYPLIKDQF